MKLYYFDIETFFNCFLFCGKWENDPNIQLFEISARMNQRAELLSWLSFLQNSGATMVGFNSLSFDYPIIHELLNNPYTFDPVKAYTEAQKIIGSQNGYGQNPHAVRLSDRIIPQVDLVKINHFDNAAKRTSLKSLQFAMRSESVEDLPFDPSKDLDHEQMNLLRSYNVHDVTETEKFGAKCKHLITMRQELLDNGVLTGDVLNFSDVKIGVEYLIKKIGRAKCFVSGSTPRQSFRTSVEFAHVILPKISFRTEPFENVLNWFKQQTIWINKKDRPSLQCRLAGIEFNFGVGGVHASVENRVYESTDTHVIRDIDVSGMYVAVAIANGFFPEHLGQDFITAYRQLQKDRAQYPKGSTMNAVLKLAGNGVYGNSNNPYSCFYDPKYTFSVTVNGQLQLLQLVEVISLIPGVEIIQANTDGITALVPRGVSHLFDLWKSDWENLTGLKLEEVEYSHVWIRDVNNYVAITTDGKIKRKGAYWFPESEREYEGWWNKDFSNVCAQRGVDAVLRHAFKPSDVVRVLTDPFDFMLRYKTPASATVFIGEKQMLKTVRYYVSTAGEKMKKVAAPKGAIGAWKRRNGLKDEEFLRIFNETPEGVWNEKIHTKNKSRYEIVTTSIENGWLVKECNDARNFNWSDVDFFYYAKEIEKLRIGDNP